MTSTAAYWRRCCATPAATPPTSARTPHATRTHNQQQAAAHRDTRRRRQRGRQTFRTRARTAHAAGPACPGPSSSARTPHKTVPAARARTGPRAPPSRGANLTAQLRGELLKERLGVRWQRKPHSDLSRRYRQVEATRVASSKLQEIHALPAG